MDGIAEASRRKLSGGFRLQMIPAMLSGFMR